MIYLYLKYMGIKDVDFYLLFRNESFFQDVNIKIFFKFFFKCKKFSIIIFEMKFLCLKILFIKMFFIK